MPQQIELSADRSIQNTYATDGRKLKTTVKEGEELMDGTKYYKANFVFDKQKEMEYILFDEGRIVNYGGNLEYEYHLKDHLGSVRVAFVPTTSGTEIVQENAYYPFGGTIGDFSYNESENRYKHTGMEAINDFGLNMLDNNARWRDVSAVPRFYGIDPLAEKYYSISPYAYCNNNPVKYVDPDGMLPIFLIPLIKGAIGAVVDAAAQVSVSMINGQSFGEAMSNIDYTSVGASFVTSALAMPVMSTAAKVTTAAAIAVDAAVDINGKGEVRTTGGIVGDNKSVTKTAIDATVSILPGKIVDGVTSSFNKAVTADLSSNAAATLSKETKSTLKQAQATVNNTAVQTGAKETANYAGKVVGGQANEVVNSSNNSTGSTFVLNNVVTQCDATKVRKPLLLPKAQ